jgi:hypothetical protein
MNPFGSIDRITSQAAKRIEGMVSAFRKRMQAGYFPGPQHPSRDRVGKPSSNKGVSWRVRENLRPLHWQAGNQARQK